MLTIKYLNGIYSITRDGVSFGQARSLELLLQNALGELFPAVALFHASEVLTALMGEQRETHGQIATREP